MQIIYTNEITFYCILSMSECKKIIVEINKKNLFFWLNVMHILPCHIRTNYLFDYAKPLILV